MQIYVLKLWVLASTSGFLEIRVHHHLNTPKTTYPKWDKIYLRGKIVLGGARITIGGKKWKSSNHCRTHIIVFSMFQGFRKCIVWPKRCAISMVTIKRLGDGYHGNGASDMVKTILFLKCYIKSNNLRSFSMKSGHFYFSDPCRGQNLAFDCNSKTVGRR